MNPDNKAPETMLSPCRATLPPKGRRGVLVIVQRGKLKPRECEFLAHELAARDWI